MEGTFGYFYVCISRAKFAKFQAKTLIFRYKWLHNDIIISFFLQLKSGLISHLSTTYYQNNKQITIESKQQKTIFCYTKLLYTKEKKNTRN